MKTFFIFFISFYIAYSQAGRFLLYTDSFPELQIKWELPFEVSREEVFIRENERIVENFHWNLYKKITSQDDVAILFLTDASGNVSEKGRNLFQEALHKMFVSPNRFFDKKTYIGFAYYRRADLKGNTLKTLRNFVSDFKILKGIETKIVYDSLMESDLYKALYDAADKLRSASTKIKVLILLTSGRNISPSPLTKEDIIQKFQTERIIPLIFVFNESLYAGDDLRPVADLTQGHFFRIKSSGEILRSVPSFLKALHKQPDKFIYEARWESVQEALPVGSVVHLQIEVKNITADTSYTIPALETPKRFSSEKLTAGEIGYILLGVGGIVLLAGLYLFFKFRRKAGKQPIPPKKDLLKTVISDVPKDTYNVEVITSGIKTVVPLVGKSSWTIGRASDNDIVIGDVTVSKYHARFMLINGKLYVEDLGSTNGIVLNSEEIKNSVLKKGDLLKLGETMLKIK